MLVLHQRHNSMIARQQCLVVQGNYQKIVLLKFCKTSKIQVVMQYSTHIKLKISFSHILMALQRITTPLLFVTALKSTSYVNMQDRI